MDTMALGQKIRDLRKTKGLTQEALSAKSGVDRRVIQKIEGGSGSPTLTTLLALSGTLDVQVVDLMSSVDYSPLPDFNLASRVLSQIGALSPNSQRTILAFVLDDDSYIAEHPDRAKLLRLLQEFRKLR